MSSAEIVIPPSGSAPTPRVDYDSPWKEVSGRFFPELVDFFAPDLHAVIDWLAGYELLEQELREMLRDAETGPRRVDKVVKVRTLAGQPLYLVLHVEIQVSREAAFPQRMFVYYYRLYDLYPEQVIALESGPWSRSWPSSPTKSRTGDLRSISMRCTVPRSSSATVRSRSGSTMVGGPS